MYFLRQMGQTVDLQEDDGGEFLGYGVFFVGKGLNGDKEVAKRR